MTEIIEQTKFISGDYFVPITLKHRGNRTFVYFAYNKRMIEEVKAMEGAKYHGFDEEKPEKVWSIAKSPRNAFQIAYLQGKNPYAVYDLPLIPYEAKPRWNHELQKEILPREYQIDMVRHPITRRCAIIAGEMGTGKTLAYILAMEWLAENLGLRNWWYIANKAGVRSFEHQMWVWGCKIRPTVVSTYDGLVKIVANWSGEKAPDALCGDETSKVKNIATKRAQAFKWVADAIRNEHQNHSIIEISGSPAPKSPVDWWSQCEIACPGFLREGSPEKLKKRMALVVEKENVVTGGTYPELITWYDNEEKCKKCGKLRSEHDSSMDPIMAELQGIADHAFEKSVNEVHNLYKRMNGLVMVKLKRDCLDLPEKQYERIILTPSAEALRTAQAIVDSASSAAQGLTLLRELSDGFQYQDKKIGVMPCEVCNGKKKRTQAKEVENSCPNCGEGDCLNHTPQYTEELCDCDGCNGTGEKPRYERFSIEVPCPKEDALREILENHEEIGRLVVFAGFEGSVDRCTRIAKESGWHVIRVDGRGWICYTPKGEVVKEDPLKMFQGDDYERVVWVGHPQSGGTSVTLTRSPTIVYYSNSFNGEDRIQSEDRIHRLGMDSNLGATIIDLFHLSSDERVFLNVKKKRELQNMSLGEFREIMANITERVL